MAMSLKLFNNKPNMSVAMLYFLKKFSTFLGGVTANPADDYIEDVVCNDEDIRENEMKTFDLQDAGKVLLVRQNGKLSAIGTKCTHYGAPLVTGALGKGRVRCPWHGACFNVTTGDIEDFPGMDSLPCYQVTVANNQVTVRARRSDLDTNKRIKTMTSPCQNLSASVTYVIIGGGPSGATCAETLRQEGFTGRIVLICKENALPYDRVKVSKALDVEIEKIQFRNNDFYASNGIEVYKGVEATGVNTRENTVTLSNGEKVKYAKLYVATGSKAVKSDIPGVGLKNIEVLRDHSDAVYVQSQLGPETEVVVLGSSFIALEVASYCVNKVKKVTVVMRGDAPFKPLLGPRIGATFKKFFEEKNVNFISHSGIVRCLGTEKIESVELKTGEILKTDLCIMGIGSKLYTDFLRGSGIEIRDDDSIEVDDTMRTNVANVYAGGDVAYAPVWSNDGRKSVIGHYGLAQVHGRVAGLNMAGRCETLKNVPFFWTMLFGKSVRYAGHGRYDDVLYAGDVENLKFAAFYLDGDRVVAVASCQMDPVTAEFAEWLAGGKKLCRGDLGEDLMAWRKKIFD